jgi:hypothetical protein
MYIDKCVNHIASSEFKPHTSVDRRKVSLGTVVVHC